MDRYEFEGQLERAAVIIAKQPNKISMKHKVVS